MEFSNRERIMLAVIAAFAMFSIYLLYLHNEQSDEVITPERIERLFVDEDTGPIHILVHVTGQVNAKGVIKLEEGSRVIDAVNAAGGPTELADLDAVNLARMLYDGERLYIPAIGEAVADGSPIDGAMAGEGKVDINRASASELETLPGIGKVLAQRIIEYRDKHGRFNTPEDIMKVSGIGLKIFDDIKDKIRIR
jgi:competence protein ComEA